MGKGFILSESRLAMVERRQEAEQPEQPTRKSSLILISAAMQR
jgi:hypothetical protein